MPRGLWACRLGRNQRGEWPALLSSPKRALLAVRDASAAKTAVAEGVLGEVLLVVRLSEVEVACGDYLSRDPPVASRMQPFLVALEGRQGCFFLVGSAHKYDRSILRAYVCALAHSLRRIVALPKDLQEGLVADPLGPKDYPYCLGMAGATAAYHLVGGVGYKTAFVANCGHIDAF